MIKCFNPVGGNCPCCQITPIKYGKSGNVQRYYCKNCKKTWLADYTKQAYSPSVNLNIVALVKEGCGIRSIARLLNISAVTVHLMRENAGEGQKRGVLVLSRQDKRKTN